MPFFKKKMILFPQANYTVFKILALFILVNLFTNAIAQTSSNNEIELSDVDKNVSKTKKNVQSTTKRFNDFIKEYNNEIHSQQYLNDSAFEEILHIKDDINKNKKNIARIQKNLQYIRTDDVEHQIKSQQYFNLLLILILLLFAGGGVFIFLNRRIFTKMGKELDEKLKKNSKVSEISFEKMNVEYYEKLNSNEKSLKNLSKMNKQELIKKLNDYKEHVDARFREINSQLEDKFSSPK